MMANICIECKNAVPNKEKGQGCPWSERFEPVPGWDAEMTILKYHVVMTNSYDVRECPLFEEG